jgi:hypothetical protein
MVCADIYHEKPVQICLLEDSAILRGSLDRVDADVILDIDILPSFGGGTRSPIPPNVRHPMI